LDLTVESLTDERYQRVDRAARRVDRVTVAANRRHAYNVT
jgi:hypothetical protein